MAILLFSCSSDANKACKRNFKQLANPDIKIVLMVCSHQVIIRTYLSALRFLAKLFHSCLLTGDLIIFFILCFSK